MIVLFHNSFDKDYQQLRKSEQERFKTRLTIFIKNPSDPQLGNHMLKGRYEGYRSINIGGDLRALYKTLNINTIIFVL